MRGFLAVVRRELGERWLLLLVAVAAGFFPLVVPSLSGVAGRHASELRSDTALALALVVAAVLALVLGASVIVGDLTERRFGFYFTRPIGGWAIWAGKLTGAVIVAAGAALLVLLPSLLLGGRVEVGTPWVTGSAWPRGLPGALLLIACGTIGVLAVSHVVSTMVRSRSPWLLLDVGAAFALAALVWGCRRELWTAGALGSLGLGLGWLLASLVAVALAASAVQVIGGRTDLQRGHRLLSLTLWTGLGLAGAAFGAYTRWVVSVTPADVLDVGQVAPAPSGSWIAFRGAAGGRAGYAPAFLFDTASGRWLKLNVRSYWSWLEIAFSRDGSRAAWLEQGEEGGVELKTLDLNRPGARPATPPVSFHQTPRKIELSPDGSLLAVLQDDGALTVEDLAAGRLLAADSIHDASEGSIALHFESPDRLRVLHLVDEPDAGIDRARHRLDIGELAIPRGRIAVTARAGIAGGGSFGSVSYEGERALLSEWHVLHLVDLRSGSILAELPITGIGLATGFLADGRIVVTERSRNGVDLRLLSPDGAPLRRYSFRAHRLLMGGEVTPGRLVLTTISGAAKPRDRASFILDLASGGTTSLGRNLLPACLANPWTPRATEGITHGLGSRLFLRHRRAGQQLMLVESSGRLRALTGRPGDDP